jgi:peptidoglycan/LPS O-acetylase OafA/YrhL
LLRGKDQFGQIHLQSFYVRRMLRIWPLRFLGILIAALLPLVDTSQSFPPKYVVAFLLLSGNLRNSTAGPPSSVMNPLWSVDLEEQFYRFWPAVISRTRRTGTRHPFLREETFQLLLTLCLCISAVCPVTQKWNSG